MTYPSTISAVKANRLFWLGRYAERTYLNLHLLRKYFDLHIDEDEGEYDVYFEKLGIDTAESSESKFMRQMYDRSSCTSVINDIERANDNAILLREEIQSETLSYIQLSRSLIHTLAGECNPNITAMQPVTDYMLAFWGSIAERIPNGLIRNFLEAGRYVEKIDMYIRFDYPFGKVRSVFDNLMHCVANDPAVFNHEVVRKMSELMREDLYLDGGAHYKGTLLCYVNSIVVI